MVGRIPKNKKLRVMSGKLPPKQKFLDGNKNDFDHDYIENNDDNIIRNMPVMPKDFDEEHKELWDKTIELLKENGDILRSIDGAVLEAYCSSFIRWRRTEKELRKIAKERTYIASLISKGAQTIVVNPLITVSNKAKTDMVDCAIQLGMTPAARLRMESSFATTAQKRANIFKQLKDMQK